MKIRASQINGCANCLHMHTSDARAKGETEARIYLLNAWRESTLYSAAGARGAGLDEVPDPGRRDPRAGRGLREATAQFTDEELIHLTLAISDINAWNWIAIGFRAIHPVTVKAAA